MQAVILAAGMGRRLDLISGGLPKPMLNITGKSIIHSQIESCQQYGVEQFVIVIGYYQAEMKAHILEILTPEQVEIRGKSGLCNHKYFIFLITWQGNI